ncbi:glycoside hydrolase family 2 TIM barrel-domain containing protein [Caulobacter sp. LjRoot300]|uniref:glycoside hydrolase family 2 TIM barrel-domain containing protein n=1 Tax=Caulobacter sp. LjRoot300 TaxID=3342321 RepID=UPI003ECE8B46
MKRLLLATTMAILVAPLVAPAIARAEAASDPVRVQTPLAQDWRFRQDDGLSGVESPAFNDQDWARVTVPHTWNRVGLYLPGPVERLNGPETINKTQGVGWYRLSFTAPKLDGRRSYLQFDAASRNAKVWLNGVYLGEHQGGFSRFRLDATDALRADGQNLLVVRADNTKPAPGSATADNLPLTGDFFVHGGLYRPVSLVLTSPVHFDMLDFGGPGVYATTTDLAAAKAGIQVRARLRNDLAKARPVRLETRLYDAAGHVAAQASASVALPAKGGSEAALSLSLADPHPWNGTADPYLYRLETDLVGADGKVLDRVSTPFGVRQMGFDPGRGFLLNGKPYRLHGVGYHQDREGKGWAIDAADVEEDMAILWEMGANTIRLTHYQHGQVIHDLADKYGFVLWDEIPLVSAWTTGGALEPTPGLVENARQQLKELIRQNANHASVATWGIANEVDFGNSFPAFLTGYKNGAPDPMPLLKALNTLAHEEDPSRPTALATCCEGRVFAAGVDVPTTAEAADLGGANRYFGWYFGAPDDLGPHLDALHAKRPRQPLSVTEYGAGGGVTIHTDDVLGGPIDSRGRVQPEEYESHIHETAWATLSQKPYLWGTWLWNAFDFATTIRHEGDADDINTKGLVTYDRKIRKDAWYFYKANWATTPTVHINGRRYVDRSYPVTDVRVYSNGAATELTLNGRSLGERADCPQRVCVWPAVRLEPGENVLVARARFEGQTVEDRIIWRRPTDANAPIRIDAGSLVGAGKTVKFGSDAFFKGGQALSANTPADYGRPEVRAAITGTEEIDAASSYRQGRFTYAIPLTPGRYSVRLTFVEPKLAAGERRFDVVTNGARILPDLDVAAEAGGPLKALTRTFETSAADQGLTLAFNPSQGEAIVSTIEITPLQAVKRQGSAAP